MQQKKCSCGSGNTYATCCGRFHRGELAQTALELMRSRYSAYALKKIDYIIQTTHPAHADWKKPLAQWKQELLNFSTHTSFQRLEILAVQEGSTLSFVTFQAHLSQAGKDVSFTECSRFEKLNDRWFYRSGGLQL